MNLFILASALIFAFVISVGIKRYDKESQKAKEDFWEKERKSNFVRKKNLDNLNYITVPEEFYTYNYNITNTKVKDAYDSINHLKSCKIVNFSGITNTDLKLEYGTANINILSEYDYNYTTLARSLQILADSLIEKEDIDKAKKILLFLINSGTDMKKTYTALGDIYYKEYNINELNSLINQAENFNGLMKSAILEYLNELKMKINTD